MQAHKAQDIASKRGKLLTDDFMFLIRKVPFFMWLVHMEDSFVLLVV